MLFALAVLDRSPDKYHFPTNWKPLKISPPKVKKSTSGTELYHRANFHADRRESVVELIFATRCVCVCVRVSVMLVHSVKTNKHIFKLFSPSGSHTILPNASRNIGSPCSSLTVMQEEASAFGLQIKLVENQNPTVLKRFIQLVQSVT